MRVVAIIQARMRSTRLPGKIMKTLCGRTVLAHDIERIGAATRVDDIVVATSDLAVDDEVAAEALRAGAKVSRGSEEDVLARFYDAAREHQADVIVRMTSDCPLFDPLLLDRMLAEFLAALPGAQPYDYYSNTLNRRTYPTGLDTEIFTMAALARAHQEGRRPPEREHVTPYLHQNPQLFHLGGMEAERDHSRYRWTLDTPADLELIGKIYAAVYREDRLFTTAEVLQLMADQPELAAINQHIEAKPIEPDEQAPGGTMLIRADASPDIGAGHVMRCLALAQAWAATSGRVVFAMAEGIEIYGPRLRAEGFVVEPVTAATDAESTIALASQYATDWIVVDGYGFEHAYFEQMIAARGRVLVLDDCGRTHLSGVDLVLNQNLHADAGLYPGLHPETKLLAGVEHVLLRQDFLTAERGATDIPARAKNILITVGGGDPDNLSGRIVDVLAELPLPGVQVRVLVGAASPHFKAVAASAGSSAIPVEVLAEVNDMPAHYRWADLAITGGGSTLWELAYIGVPALTFVLADNQEASSLRLDQLGTVRCLGRPAKLCNEDLAIAVTDLVTNVDLRRRMIATGRQLIDGRGSQRVIRAMAHKTVPEVTA